MAIFAVLAFLWFLFVFAGIVGAGLIVARAVRSGRVRYRHGSSGPYGSTWNSDTGSYGDDSWGGSPDGGSSWDSSDCGSSSDSSSSSDSGSSCS